jgi:hypothetical protein
MADTPKLAHAQLQEIRWSEGAWQEAGSPPFDVQFNPQSLKVAYANQTADSPGGNASPMQYVGQGTTKLTLDLLFDATVPPAEGERIPDDVRVLTQQVRRYVQPVRGEASDEGEGALTVPALRLLWGSFKFDGVVDSINETLDFFSSDGRPLRATVALAMTSQEIRLEAERNDAFQPAAGAAGTTPQTPATAGAPLQQRCAELGKDWKRVAAANDIENPRLIPPGTLIDFTASARAGVRF